MAIAGALVQEGYGVTVAAADMIQATDVAEAVRMLLRLTPGCVIPEIIVQAPGAMPAGLPA